MKNKERKKLENNIWKIYIYQILQGVFFSVPVIVIFWQNNGLSLVDIMWLQSFYALFTVVMEIPSGYFADRYGRKKSLIIAGVSIFLGMISYSLAHNFLGFFLGEFFFALFVSFTSGAITALLFDTLKGLEREEEYQKIWGKALFYGMISLATSGIVGGFIAKVDLRYTLFASVPFFFLLIPLTFSLKEPLREEIIIKKNYLKELFNTVKKYLTTKNKQNRKLKWIIFYSVIIHAFNQSVLWLYQSYFKLSGVDVIYFGAVFASFQVISAFSSKYAHKLEKRLGEKYSFIMLIFLVAVSFLLMSNFIFLFSFSFAFIQQFVRGYKNIIVSDYINRIIGSELRATILSVESFFGKLLYASIIPIIGWVADVYSLTQALAIMGGTALILGIMFMVSFRVSRIFK